MSLRQDTRDLYDNGKKGDWCFFESTDGTVFIALKFGDESFTESVTLPISQDNKPATWQWNGNKEAPTLTPSILVWGNGKDKSATWHGYLREGKLVTV
jgi:hypothetical protein